MARFADTLSQLQSPRHQFRKPTLVRVLMAGLAGAIGEVVFPVSAGRRIFFSVAILASNGCVRALQGERRRLVLFQSEGRGMEAFHLMAVFAAVEVRGARELQRMRVLMTIGTPLKRRVIVGIETGRWMALGTFQALMLARQWIFGRLMGGFGKRCGFPTGIRVTSAAFAVIGAAHKLPFVLVLVAVHAFFVLDRLFEVRVFVALVAGQTLVLAVQRELGFAVIEIAAGDVHTFPSLGIVT